MDGHGFLFDALVYLSAAIAAVLVSKRLGLGSVLGYLAAGSAIGPSGLKLITDPRSLLHFSELGVVFLLFLIGLELQPSRLWAMRRAVFGLGAAQVALTTLLLGGAAAALGVSPTTALLVGVGLSFSSTAFALQLLGERNQINTQFGQVGFAVLLFQDLAVIPVLAAVPFLTGTASASAAHPGVALGVVALVAFGGRYLLRPVFRLVTETRIREIFTAASLLLVIGVGLVMEAVGLSMGLGAFLAGVLLSGSEYRHELEADIEPFKGLLLGLFFMAVGMSVDYRLAAERPGELVGAVLGLVAVKVAVLYGLGRAARLGPDSSRNLALVLSQGGEFAFVLFGTVAGDGAPFLVLVVTLSMALTPVLVALNDRFLAPWLHRAPEPYDAIDSEDNPVIIAGFGRVGQIPARILRVKRFGYTALEHDPEQVSGVRRFGQKIYYGDASRLDLLEAAGARKAKVFLLAIDDVESSLRTAEVVRTHFPHLAVFARARNRQHAHRLMELGIERIYRETFATSLEMAHDILRELGLGEDHARETVGRFREHDERTPREALGVYKDEQALINYSKRSAEQLADLFRTDRK